MEASDELQACIARTLIPGMGDTLAKKCISAMGSAQQVLQAGEGLLQQVYGVGSFLTQSIRKHRKQVLQRAEQEVEFVLKHRIHAQVYNEQEYPRRLKLCADGPVVLFARGKMEPDKGYALGIVGTRNITPYGAAITAEIIRELIPYQPLVVSGLAFGVDIHAHRAAMEHGLQTIASMAHGMDMLYPKSHRKYARRIMEHGGLVTDFLSNTIPEKENFVKRNRIIAGLSDAVLVIESAEKGGSLITADLAQGYNRDVLAVPGKAGDTYSRGCNQLIRNHQAALVTSGKEVAETLMWVLPEQNKKKEVLQAALFADLNKEEEALMQALGTGDALHVDYLSEKTGFTTPKVNGMLLTLELKGIVKGLPGSRFTANVTAR